MSAKGKVGALAEGAESLEALGLHPQAMLFVHEIDDDDDDDDA